MKNCDSNELQSVDQNKFNCSRSPQLKFWSHPCVALTLPVLADHISFFFRIYLWFCSIHLCSQALIKPICVQHAFFFFFPHCIRTSQLWWCRLLFACYYQGHLNHRCESACTRQTNSTLHWAPSVPPGCVGIVSVNPDWFIMPSRHNS